VRAVLIGSVLFSRIMLEELLSRKEIQMVGVCTLENDGSDSDRIDLTPLCLGQGIPVRYSPDINDRDVFDWISSLQPEVIFCFGWSRLIREPLLSLAPRGIIGYHPSALPANRGRHPIIWALALGLHETGSTFFVMDEGQDSGNIISQRIMPISDDDDAASLYARITATAAFQMDEVIHQVIFSDPLGVPQIESHANYWRKRERKDGEIDWRMCARNIRNLVRALSKPYSGAHFTNSEGIFKVWNCRVIESDSPQVEPGKILRVDDDGILVQCGVGLLLMTSVDPNPPVREGDYL
jgi:methionyl-tRNA formyltransferase